MFTLLGIVSAVNYVYRQNTESTIHNELVVAERVFLRLLQERGVRLIQLANALVGDFAFKRVMATQDIPTISSALKNLSDRVRADVAYLVSTGYEVIALDSDSPETGQVFFAADLIERAEELGGATRLMVIDKTVYQLIVVPVLAPRPIAWLCIGFAIDENVLFQLKQLTRIEISLLSEQNAIVRLHASTLEEAGENFQTHYKTNPDGSFWRESDELYLSRWIDLEHDEGSSGMIAAVIERSWESSLDDFYRLQWLMIAISLVSVGAASVAAFWLANAVSKPVQRLAQGVQAIHQGNYEHQVRIDSEDELGELGIAFNGMGMQLLEKEKIRALIGKMVSPAVADELMKQDIVLGGELREITALFSDIEGFTGIAEQMQPQELISLLNEYLTHMSSEIGARAGVLDKFVGDAIVAFWGAPIDEVFHAQQAVYCALGMQQTLRALRTEWSGRNLPVLKMRIGISTGKAIVGNIGSVDRLDYTMIGDTVNLAARLEGANKYYGSEILVSEHTYAHIKDVFLCRELDRVRVQGKRQSVSVYEVIAEKAAATPEQLAMCGAFSTALEAYRAGEWDRAKPVFARLAGGCQDGVSKLYLERLSASAKNSAALNPSAINDLAKNPD